MELFFSQDADRITFFLRSKTLGKMSDDIVLEKSDVKAIINQRPADLSKSMEIVTRMQSTIHSFLRGEKTPRTPTSGSGKGTPVIPNPEDIVELPNFIYK